MELLRKTIRPEFLNRIDETIVFTPLSRTDINQIVKLQFNQVVKRLSGSDVKISLTEKAIDWLAAMSYDPHFGARPVKRILQKQVLNELSRKILAGQVDKSKSIEIDVENDGLVFRN
jgi:ATP-dependent Clp protease ATP-binding subunit ClpB